MTRPHLPRSVADVVLDARRAPDVTDLHPPENHPPDAHPAVPGPPAGPAPTGGPDPRADPEHVWYVSYGSNLLRERFEVYLLGGRVPGLAREYPGGPGTAPATDDRAVVLPGRLRFALDAPSWGGGGVAFWDPDGEGPGVLARAWRVRLPQFLEVVHMENGGRDRRSAPWPADVLRTGEAEVGEGWYSRLLRPGLLGGEPLLTFTHREPRTLATREPSRAYRSTIARGGVETFAGPGRGGVDLAAADGYLAAVLTG